MFAKYPAVQITRNRSDFFDLNGALKSSAKSPSLLSASISTFATSESSSTSASTATSNTNEDGSGNTHSVILGIGSNMGERMGNITRALKELESIQLGGEKTRVVDTSFLYESEAMYVVDQAKFLNAVVRVRWLRLA
jgi:dihydroneopterin aldolase/2-amino-4-hydroxy-6-hydroxymethyldihydropteridine diphosphokinase/dihydropteroate synthase